MNTYATAAVVLGFIAAMSLPASAQNAPVATLEVTKGVVMTSTGGEFATVSSGHTLVANERVMVSKGASATIVYSNENCRQNYRNPGVYTIAASCAAVADVGSGAAASTGSGAAGVVGTVAFVAAGAVAVGVIAHNISDDNNDDQPISR